MHAPVPLSSAQPVAPGPQALLAPDHWRQIDFISDLHLQASEPLTFAAWKRYMQNTPANAVFILGDLFEVWVGDDALAAAAQPSFEDACVEVLKAASQRLSLYVLHGNRDFLLGNGFAQASGAVLLDDPCCLSFAGARWLLSHGDALCLEDTDYLQFREQVRHPDWQRAFLAKPLAERQAIARSLRTESEARKQSGADYADVNEAAACAWLEASHATTLVHGHTHKPADHELNCKSAAQAADVPQPPLRRLVLSDWDASAHPPRTEVLRLGLAHPPSRIRV